MWFIYALVTFFAWGVADLYYKKANEKNERYSHIKTGIIVGFVMGIHAIIYWIVTKTNVHFFEVIKYLPVSLSYIASMVIGYKGLKYINLSISSPIQNSSGVITSILLCLIFKVVLKPLEIIGILIVFLGVLALSILEIHYNKMNKHEIFKKISIQAVFFPILYCVIDGLGTFLDAVYLDHLELIGEDVALISYELTFFVYGIFCLLYLKYIKNEDVKVFNEKNKIKAALFETLGQFTYVFAVTSHSVITIPIIACYSALSVLLSRIFLKEKITMLQYIAILIIFIGIFILGLVEAFA